jgi:fucose permease
MDASSVPPKVDDYGMYTTEISHHNPIELKNLLSSSDSRRNSQDEDSLPNNTNLIKEIDWQGEKVKTYPLNYQTVPLVKLQVIACLIMFVVFGMNDQTVGALLPTLIEYYHISRVDVSNVFIVQLCGYVMASLSNERLNKHFGMRGGMLLAAGLCIVFLIILATAPSSFYVCMFCGLPLGLGIGILDSTGNVLMGSLLVHKNELMGIMHGLYGAAAMVTPPLVSYFVEWGHWSLFFLIPLFFSIIGMIVIFPAFKFETASKYDYLCSVENKESNNDVEEAGDNSLMESTKASPGFFELLRNPAIFLYSLYLFLYLGAEITTGSWFFSYLLETKSSNKVAMSYIAASF